MWSDLHAMARACKPVVPHGWNLRDRFLGRGVGLKGGRCSLTSFLQSCERTALAPWVVWADLSPRAILGTIGRLPVSLPLSPSGGRHTPTHMTAKPVSRHGPVSPSEAAAAPWL